MPPAGPRPSRPSARSRELPGRDEQGRLKPIEGRLGTFSLPGRAQTAVGGIRSSRDILPSTEDHTYGTTRRAGAHMLMPLPMPIMSQGQGEWGEGARRSGHSTARPITSHGTAALGFSSGSQSARTPSNPRSRPGSHHASHRQLPQLELGTQQKAALAQLKLSAMLLLADGVDVGNMRLADLADLSPRRLRGGRFPKDRLQQQRKASNQLLLLAAYQPSYGSTLMHNRSPRSRNGRNVQLSSL